MGFREDSHTPGHSANKSNGATLWVGASLVRDLPLRRRLYGYSELRPWF